MASSKARLSHLHPLTRTVHLHLRLFVACIVGVMGYFALSGIAATATRLLCAWDLGVAVYLVLAGILISGCDVGRLRQRAAEDDEGALVIMVLAVVAVAASIGAIFIELGAAKAKPDGMALHGALAVATIMLSWSFIHVMFAQHYAYEYYDEDRAREGLKFPGKAEPEYWDFVYFSLVIGMTSQVSDVAVTNAKIRRTVMLHGVLSFIFNTTIIALSVNMASNAL
jgi:uncharacterized membrane protein